jgi:hypothetical protein
MKFLNILFIATALSFTSCAGMSKKECKSSCTDKQCKMKKAKKSCCATKQCKLKGKKCDKKKS